MSAPLQVNPTTKYRRSVMPELNYLHVFALIFPHEVIAKEPLEIKLKTVNSSILSVKLYLFKCCVYFFETVCCEQERQFKLLHLCHILSEPTDDIAFAAPALARCDIGTFICF